ncbi:MAG: TIGR02611 family protein [Pseudonocardia sp.]|nr:TIGR02611 family protein [Pseudonocardia sp.]
MTGGSDRPPGIRARIEERPTIRRAWRTGVAVAGAAVLVVGIIAIPYPGPGWFIVFAGLAILASEFTWARRLLHYARGKYDAWTEWLSRRSPTVRILVIAATALIVVATLWLLNAFWLVAEWVGVTDWMWLRSPLLG